MALYLGIDTSNYTTSAALYDQASGQLEHQKLLLPVPDGELGLRQSDAVFAHVKSLGAGLGSLLVGKPTVSAVGVSVSPRDAEGSYMPCFLVGRLAAQAIGAALAVPVYEFSHQAGHLCAALYGADRMDLLGSRFLAFHVSGGTTECLLAEASSERLLAVTVLAHTADLHAGQAVDRVAGMLGLPFPGGPQLERLAMQSARQFSPKPAFQGANPCFSGLQNKCGRMLADGTPPADIAAYSLDFIAAALNKMAEAAQARHPGLPLVFSGGVMSNIRIREYILRRRAAYFAPPALSADNAAGPALLAAAADARGKKKPGAKQP